MVSRALIFYTILVGMQVSCGERLTTAGKQEAAAHLSSSQNSSVAVPVPCEESLTSVFEGSAILATCEAQESRIAARFNLTPGEYTIRKLELSKTRQIQIIAKDTGVTLNFAADFQITSREQNNVDRKVLSINNVDQVKIGNNAQLNLVEFNKIAQLSCGDNCKFSHATFNKSKEISTGQYSFGAGNSFVDAQFFGLQSLTIGQKAYFEMVTITDIKSLTIGNDDNTVSIDLNQIAVGNFQNTSFWREQVSSLKLSNSTFKHTLRP